MKKFICFITTIVMLSCALCFILTGCGQEDEIDALKNQISELQEQLESLQSQAPAPMKVYKKGETATLYSNNSIMAEVTFVGWDNREQLEVFIVKNLSPMPFPLGNIAFAGVSYIDDEYFTWFTKNNDTIIHPNESVEYRPPRINSSDYQYIVVGFDLGNSKCLKNIIFEL